MSFLSSYYFIVLKLGYCIGDRSYLASGEKGKNIKWDAQKIGESYLTSKFYMVF